MRLQPLVVVLRPTSQDLIEPYSKNHLFSLVEKLNSQNVRHIEIAWSNHHNWPYIIKELKTTFKEISLGAASITTSSALKSAAELELSYAMMPFWDIKLQNQSRELNQVLIPGVFSPSEINQAISFGCELIKLFPASSLGIDYWQQIKISLKSLPFIIAAGGLTAKELNAWLDAGYDAIVLGRKLIANQKLDPELTAWLAKQAK